MGLLMTKMKGLYKSFSGGHHSKILLLGLDGAGKTTLLYKLKLNETITTVPTIGFNVETVRPVQHVSFTVWDIGGQGKIRQLWRHYFLGSEGLLFIVDSQDDQRLWEAREALAWILQSDEMTGVPVVVLANKQDVPNAQTPTAIASGLGLAEVKDRRWFVQGTSALTGAGVLEAMQELATLTKEFQKSRH